MSPIFNFVQYFLHAWLDVIELLSREPPSWSVQKQCLLVQRLEPFPAFGCSCGRPLDTDGLVHLTHFYAYDLAGAACIASTSEDAGPPAGFAVCVLRGGGDGCFHPTLRHCARADG